MRPPAHQARPRPESALVRPLNDNETKRRLKVQACLLAARLAEPETDQTLANWPGQVRMPTGSANGCDTKDSHLLQSSLVLCVCVTPDAAKWSREFSFVWF